MCTNSKDIWDRHDSFFFQYNNMEVSPDSTYQGYIACPGSHEPNWGKCGLMARAALEDDSAYFGIFREAGKNKMRVQCRMQSGDSTYKVEGASIAPSDTIEQWECVCQTSGFK